MPSLTSSDRLIWFAHCPKAGGTSVELFMVARWGNAVGHLHWGWDLWWRDGGWKVASPPNSPQHLTWNDAMTVLDRHPDVVFAVVRDPVARMQSEYRWQRDHRRGTWLGKILAFLPFAIWLRLMLAVVQRHPYAFDNHLRPQSDFVPETAHVFRLENGLADVAAWLADQVGEHSSGDTPPRALSTQAKPTTSASNASRIAVAFAHDYARFEYSPPPVTHTPDLWDRLASRIAPLIVALDRRGCL